MSSYPGDPSDPRRPRRSGAQGASRGGSQPDDAGDYGHVPSGSDDRTRRSGDSSDTPFGGYPFGGQRSQGNGGRSSSGGGANFLGLPVKLIYAMGAAIISIILVGTVCSKPTANGSVAGQVKGLNADHTITTLAGAQLTLNGAGQTFTTTSTDVDPSAEGTAAYNYRFENIPPGTYALTVSPPAGAAFQPEENLSFKVESGQLYPQSVMLLAQGIQKPRQLAQNELQPGEAGGYVNERGERVVYQHGSGFDSSDALLMYLLWRNPPGWGYGAPPVIINSPGRSTGSNYRVADPPSRTSSGQTVTQQKPTTPGQGSSRPSSGAGATGAGPSYSSGSGSGTGSSNPDAVAPAQSKPSTSSGSGSNSGSNTSTQTRPSTSTGSQGASRPSSSSPARSSAPSRSSGSSGGGRR
jgi:hypothetical protein